MVSEIGLGMEPLLIATVPYYTGYIYPKRLNLNNIYIPTGEIGKNALLITSVSPHNDN